MSITSGFRFAVYLAAWVGLGISAAQARTLFELVGQPPPERAAFKTDADYDQALEARRAEILATLETGRDARVKDLVARGAKQDEAQQAVDGMLTAVRSAASAGLARENVAIGLDNLENRLFVLKSLADLGHKRFQKVLAATGHKPPNDFFGCLCGRGFLSGVGGGYHPEPWGNCDNAMPCKGGNWGCVSFDLPSDPASWASCSAAHPAEDGTDIVQSIVAKTAAKRPVETTGRPPTDEECKAIREAAQLGIFRDIPAERQIVTVSPAAADRLKRAIKPEALVKLKDSVQRWLDEHPGAKPDELDLRTDMGLFEIGFGLDENGNFVAKEIVLKVPKVKGKIGLDFGVGLKANDSGHAAQRYEWDGKLKFGFAYEGSAQEAKYGIESDINKSAADYYDGEWQSESEYRVVRFVEDTVSRFDFYVGGSKGVGDENINIGVEYTYKLRERYSDWLFSDMNAALDSLLDNQKSWEDKRMDYIRREAERYGVDTKCLTAPQAITAIRNAYEARRITEPGLEPPFKEMRDRMAEQRRKAAEAAKTPPPKMPATPEAPVRPPVTVPEYNNQPGIYQQPMLK